MNGLLFTVLLVPLGLSAFQYLFGSLFPRAERVSVWGLALPWAFSVLLFAAAIAAEGGGPVAAWAIDWLWLPTANFRLGFSVDLLAALMLALVMTVSLLVHVFSLDYMSEHPRRRQYFTYLLFFTFAMLGLVAADNLLFLFICWEWMGLCSFLLIGFYHEHREARLAAIKAFLTTRVGDVFLLVGIAALYQATGSLRFDEIARVVESGAVVPAGVLIFACGCLLVGAMGKSAQFPLHAWLPDAMEGPSPVSALIHAATMVAAGIYLVARCLAFFPPEVLLAAAFVGGISAFLAAVLAVYERDYKRILAFSSISQLGYMLAAIGAASLTAGIFHLTTHAFFKALLFLGAGVLLHALHTRRIEDLGGLKAKLKWTYGAMAVGVFALAGIPPFAGFFSKDAVLESVLERGGPYLAVFVLLAVTALLTAFYSLRLLLLAFHGPSRNEKLAEQVHAADPGMRNPLVLLAVGAAGAGLLWAATGFSDNLSPGGAEHGLFVPVLSVLLAGLGVGWAVLRFRQGRLLTAKATAWERTVAAGFGFDKLYLAIAVSMKKISCSVAEFDRRWVDRLVDRIGTSVAGASRGAGVFDLRGIDRIVEGVGGTATTAGRAVRALQTGKIQDYAAGALAAFLILAFCFLWIG